MAKLQASSIVWEDNMNSESNEIRGVDGVENGSGRVHAARSEDLRGLSLFKRSVRSTLLGVFLAVQNVGFASAEEGTCQSFDRRTRRFDLIGLIPFFRTAAATKGLAYSALNDARVFLTGYVGPGTLSMAAALFESTGFRLASVLGLGGVGNAYGLVGLDYPQGLRYIGLKSSTECLVANPVGACLVREHASLWKPRHFDESEVLVKKKGRDAKRQVKVLVLKVGRGQDSAGRLEETRVSVKSCPGGALFLGWLPLLLTIGVLVSCIVREEWVVAGLIMLGSFGMMVAVIGLRLLAFKFSKPEVARAAPVGDCLVVDDTDADTLHIFMGEEEHIQALFQRQILCQTSSVANYMLFFAASILYIYAIGSVFCMFDDASTCGQIHFAIANLIGLVTDLVKAFQSGKLGLAKTACDQFKIVSRSVLLFNNRTAAIAFVAKHCKDPTMLKSKNLLPSDGPVWEKWWHVLSKWDGDTDPYLMETTVAAAADEDKELLQILLDDLAEGLKSS